jgi:TonB family protein
VAGDNLAQGADCLLRFFRPVSVAGRDRPREDDAALELLMGVARCRMTRMSWLRYIVPAAFLTSALMAQSGAPPAANPNPAQSAPPATTPAPESSVLIVITKKVKPEYPAAVLPEKLQGRVIVRVVVGENGDVESTEVISGNPVLAEAALDAAKQWKFKPFVRNGQPVKAGLKLPFDFAPPADLPPLPLTPSNSPDKTDATGASADAPKQIRVSSAVQRGLILHREEPVYPELARMARIQGTVVLKAIISKEGTIKDLRVVSGHPLLIQSALNAVRQWRYRPYMLLGEPVEVDTMILVQFTLSGG